MREKWFECIVIGFVAGVFARSFLPVGFSVIIFLLVISGTSLIYGSLFSLTSKRDLFALIIPLVLCAFAAGAIRYELSEPRTHLLTPYVNTTIETEGLIVAEPDERENSVLLTVELPKHERVLLIVDRFPPYRYGDRIAISGVVKEPENFDTNTGEEFDYRSYLAKDGIYFEFIRPVITLLSRDEGSPLVAALLKFKAAFLRRAALVIPEPENSLLSGLVLGEKHGLGSDLTDAFRKAGLVHVIVLSGYNLTVVAKAMQSFFLYFSFIPRGLATSAGAVGIILFTIMSGSSATAVRAAIMALIALLAKVIGRDYDILRALLLAGFVMVLHNPKVLTFDPSFQLSFLATLGLIFLSPFFERWLRWIPKRFGLREIISATLATQLFVLPRIINLSGAVSVVGILANILVLPFIPATMGLGALAGFLGFLSPALSMLSAYLAYFLLHYEIGVAKFFGGLPFASIALPHLPIWVVAISYGALSLWIFRLFGSLAKRKAPAYALRQSKVRFNGNHNERNIDDASSIRPGSSKDAGQDESAHARSVVHDRNGPSSSRDSS